MPAPNTASKLWLRLQCQMINGVAQGVLVQADSAGKPLMVAKWPQELILAEPMADVTKRVFAKQAMQMLRDTDGTILLGHPLEINKVFWGVVVVRMSHRDATGVTAAIKLLKWGETWLQYTLYKQDVPNLEPEIAILNKVADEPSLEEAAISLVNYVASFVAAERVCLGLVSQQGVALQAVSFSAHFDRRTPVMLSIAAAMEECVAANQNIFIDTTSESEQAASACPAHYRLIQNNSQRALRSVLLKNGERVVAVMLIEHSASQAVGEGAVASLMAIAPLIAQAIDLKIAAAKGVSKQLAERARGRLAKWIGPGSWLAKTLIVSALIFVVVMLLPGQYRVTGEAVLQGTQKHLVVASQDGYLAKVNVRPGDQVLVDDVLAQLDDDDLRLQRRKLISELQQHRHTYNNALANSERAQATIASALVDQATIQLELIEQQLKRTLLRSPIEGVVVSEDVSQSVGAPVSQGERLFEIVANQQYRVLLYIDERDIAYIKKQQRGHVVLTSLPGEVFEFDVLKITPLNEVREGRNYFRVEAQLLAAPATLRPGMTGNGKIAVGEFKRGWIWFHNAVDWFRVRFWW
ncbi:efflux RND transporter periplasmic adaptor subunit [Saccharophagus degradans]|uniref:HlyD family efflux transporter periplasmic adaptor subunit n=1 Tax=Saccharophagus degradans TaxID=86304 RepID=A0AAW7X1M7_9GAMM|nr:HlyD family efflux transporter periplasmic adaptor subunit [Saccharophagus degradans]MDO6421394.1 HlyD family efflux transporter periplasmic adaptor subunit [Saccharophagus degradans]MDO6609590.1 HlyD family efflux transporter periplasmic adaptor subunit [Saccharophagus degradans]